MAQSPNSIAWSLGFNVGKNRIGPTGAKYIVQADFAHLKTIGLGTSSFTEHKISSTIWR
jgi:hypothetical protein